MPNKPIRIIGVPIDLGQNQRGVDMGPSAIRYAGLSPRLRALGRELHDEGNLYV
ncbi:MAG: arginase family protein, partial [Desulfuromusa sp.]|nr:arginase family protein [Desulfuromusa sp.]